MRIVCIMLALALACGARAQMPDDIYGDIRDESTAAASVKPGNVAGQEKKARDKWLKQRVDSMGHAKAAAALERGYWVLLADRVNVGYTGYTASGLDGNSNFIFQQAGEGVIQTAFNQASPGLNGMGGMTLQGNVSGVKMSVDKKGNIHYAYSIFSQDISAQVDVMVYAGTDYAQAVIDPTFSGPRITVSGRLVPYIRPRQ